MVLGERDGASHGLPTLGFCSGNWAIDIQPGSGVLMANDRRVKSRTECMVPGRITSSEPDSVFDCIVWDIAEDGARLGVSNGDVIPEQIKLETPFNKQPRKARVLWRDRKEIGITLLD